MKNKADNLRGCNNLNGEICNSYSQNKLNVHNYLENIPESINVTDLVEVRFKNTRKEYFTNVNKLKLKSGDMVAVEASPGHDIGTISLTGELVKEQLKKNGLRPDYNFKKIYRLAKPIDVSKWERATDRENSVMLESRRIAKNLGLSMKIGDVEFQGDGSKAIFYYIADGRVDFRKLIRVLAGTFKIRIEMKQIGARQEAGRIGGFGSCGRELCCSKWLTDFVSVTTDVVREQEISLNPEKLAGQCGKLKCCMNFEVDCYKDAKKSFPKKINLKTSHSTAYYLKTDVYKKLMWYNEVDKNGKRMLSIPLERVQEVLDLNKAGKKPDTLEKIDDIVDLQADFDDILDNNSLTRFDKKKKKQKNKPANRKQRSSRRNKRHKESNPNKHPNNRKKN
ncbi:MAG: regulatory iron-sulfur-containing complex subunit RicT [Bacteroidota bacterium]|nr:regulatory iron-sulfur-containing complex subunit RicT [Bacteroidota bacterium]